MGVASVKFGSGMYGLSLLLSSLFYPPNSANRILAILTAVLSKEDLNNILIKTKTTTSVMVWLGID
jgi:hypothetical protein